jgi:hypothetical protein
MKTFTAFSLVLLQGTAVLSLPAEFGKSRSSIMATRLSDQIVDKRQLLDGLLSMMVGKPMAPILTKKLLPEIDPKATREMLVWGPYKMLSSKAPSHPSKGMAGGIKLDPNSDTQSAVLAGICKECMVLQANMETSDKTGNKVGITEGIYTHHFITVDMGRSQVPNPVKSTCTGGGMGMLGGMGGMMTPKPAGAKPHAHERRQFGGSPLFAPGVSVFVGKGNELGPSIFAPQNSTVKSGFYLSTKDKIYMTGEFVNYEPADRDVYVMLDYEYIPSADGKRPADYMDVGMGSIAVDGCMVTALGTFLILWICASLLIPGRTTQRQGHPLQIARLGCYP